MLEVLGRVLKKENLLGFLEFNLMPTKHYRHIIISFIEKDHLSIYYENLETAME